MKKILLSSFLIFSALLVTQTICRAQTTVQTVPLYRLRFIYTATNTGGSNQSEHFYTANKAERDSAINNLKGYTRADKYAWEEYKATSFYFADEGSEGYLSPKEVPGTVPLYRLYKDGPKHFYTADAAEKDKAISQYGYKLENIVGYVSAVQKPGTTPLYRLYRAAKGNTRDDHFYTTKEDEKFGAIHKYGYADEGIACYVWTSAVALSTAPPIRRKP